MSLVPLRGPMGTVQRRSSSIASYARRRALALTLPLLAACGEPMVDAVAVWVDGIADQDGNRRLRIYDAGTRDSLPIVPDIPGTSLDLLQVGLDGRGAGIAVSGDDVTVWVERESGRTVSMGVEQAGPEAVATGFFFSRSGDAMLQRYELETELGSVWLLATLSGEHALEIHSVEPLRPAMEGLRWSLHQASDAPVLVLAEVGGAPVSVRGRVQAMAYPSAWGEGPVVDDLRPLAQGTMTGRGLEIDGSRYLPSPGCPERLCLSPSGRVLYALSDFSCSLLRWSWVDAATATGETFPEEIPLACPGERDAGLLAVLDDDLVVLDDSHRLYLVDLEANLTQAVPKPTGVLEARLAGRGRVLLVMSSSGALVRVDRMGVRTVSGIQSPCNSYDALAVSPDGHWVVRSCNGEVVAPDGLDGQVQRVSVLGAELFGGIPMRPIAVDDDGNALLYSISSDDDDGVPRGLFVLGGDGTLSRVDELEPFPGRVSFNGLAGEQTVGRFVSVGPG